MAGHQSMSRIFAISDLHVDMKENLRFVESWSDEKYKDDVVIVAGDLTDHITLLRATLQSIKNKFKHTFYVPGEIAQCQSVSAFYM